MMTEFDPEDIIAMSAAIRRSSSKIDLLLIQLLSAWSVLLEAGQTEMVANGIRGLVNYLRNQANEVE